MVLGRVKKFKGPLSVHTVICYLYICKIAAKALDNLSKNLHVLSRNCLYLQLFYLFLFALPCILFGALQENRLAFIHDSIFTRSPKSEQKSIE